MAAENQPLGVQNAGFDQWRAGGPEGLLSLVDDDDEVGALARRLHEWVVARSQRLPVDGSIPRGDTELFDLEWGRVNELHGAQRCLGMAHHLGSLAAYELGTA